MNELLALGELAGKDLDAIKDHIAMEYNPQEGAYPYKDEASALREELDGYNFLIAYEDYGSYEGDSFFLMEKGGVLYENNGNHCSCYGFEGQWKPEETVKGSLLKRGFYFLSGDEDELRVKEYIAALPDDA